MPKQSEGLYAPDYVRYDDNLFSSNWGEILPPSGKRPFVELNGQDENPSVVVENAIAEVAEIPATAGLPETRASYTLTENNTSAKLFLPEAINENSLRGANGNSVKLSVDVEATSAQDSTNLVQAFITVAGATGSVKLTLPESVGDGGISADIAGEGGNNWEIVISHSVNGVAAGTSRSRKVSDPQGNTRGRIAIEFGGNAASVSLGAIATQWGVTWGTTDAASLREYASGASGATIAAASAFATHQLAGGVTGESASALVRNATSATTGLTLVMPSDDVRFRRSDGNGWEFRLTRGSAASITIDETERVFNAVVTASATISGVKTLWDGQTGNFSSSYTQTGIGGTQIHADALYSPATQASVTANGNGTGNSISLTLANDKDYYGINLSGTSGNSIKFRMLFNQNSSRVRVRAIEGDDVFDGEDTSVPNGASALLGTSSLTLPSTDELWLLEVGNATKQIVDTGTIKAFTAATAGTDLSSGTNRLEFVSTDPAVTVYLGRTSSNRLLVDGNAAEDVDITITKVEYNVEMLFLGAFATLQETKNLWELPQGLDPRTLSVEQLLDGIGIGGLGGTASITGSASAIVAQGQGVLSFAGGAGTRDETRIIFENGEDGMEVGVSSYEYESNTISIALKERTIRSLYNFWIRSQSNGGLGGLAEFTGANAQTFSDFSSRSFAGGVDSVEGTEGVPASPAVSAVTRKGNSVPDSKLRIRFRERTGIEGIFVVKSVPYVQFSGRATVQASTQATTLVADNNLSTTGGVRLSLPKNWHRHARVHGTFDGLGNNGNNYDLRFLWEERGALGGQATAIIDNNVITVSIEKGESDANPMVEDLMRAWKSFGGNASLEGTTAANAVLSDEATYATGNQTFSGGVHPYVDLTRTPNSLSIRDENSDDSIVVYEQQSSLSSLSSDNEYHLNDKRVSFHSAHVGRSLTVEYQLTATQVDFYRSEENTWVLVVGNEATWTHVADALNSDQSFLNKFHRISVSDDIILPATFAGSASDKPVSGIYSFTDGGWAEKQNAVVSVPESGGEALLTESDPPLREKFTATTGSAQTYTLLEATSDTQILSLSHSSSTYTFAATGQSTAAGVTADTNWNLTGKTLTYWADTAGDITVNYANGLNEDNAVVAESQSDTELTVNVGKSLYGKSSALTEGGVEAYDNKSSYSWVYGNTGFPRESTS